MENPENWQTLHNALRDSLEREIRLTRELLSNMHQEEVSLMLHDAGSLNQILQMRSPMLETLSALRLNRQKTTEKIRKMASNEDQTASLDEILPPDEAISLEILSLSDQLMALTERMSRQHTHNQRLTDHLSLTGNAQPSAQNRPKRKASIATINIIK